jgi:acyl dehydratase
MSCAVAFDEIREEVEIPPLEIDFSPKRNQDYCQFVDEINPLHFDQEYARALGYQDIVVAGIFTASLFPKVITDWLGKQARIERMQIKFENPAYLNETVAYKGKVTKKVSEEGVKRLECQVWSENPEGERLALATVALRLVETE